MKLDQIIVLLVFIGFCIGGGLLIRKANKETNQQIIGKDKENNKMKK